MTIHTTPVLSDGLIDSMEVYDAYRYGVELLESRYPRHAARVLQRVVDAEPDSADAWEFYGRAHFAAAQLGPAEQAFTRLVELQPTYEWAHTALAMVHERQNRLEEAASRHRIASGLGARTY